MELPWRLIVVKAENRAVLQAILQYPDGWPARTAVMFDRRHRERRLKIEQIATERRLGQRRDEPDAMWYTHGFIVTETARLPSQAIRLIG